MKNIGFWIFFINHGTKKHKFQRFKKKSILNSKINNFHFLFSGWLYIVIESQNKGFGFVLFFRAFFVMFWVSAWTSWCARASALWVAATTYPMSGNNNRSVPAQKFFNLIMGTQWQTNFEVDKKIRLISIGCSPHFLSQNLNKWKIIVYFWCFCTVGRFGGSWCPLAFYWFST